MKFDRLTTTLLATIGSAILFSLLNISFSLDASFFAFPLTALFTGALAFCIFLLLKYSDCTKLSVIRKLLQYLPFVLLASFIFRRAGMHATSYLYDLICVVLWIISSVVSLYALHLINPKKLSKHNPHLASLVEALPKVQRSRFKRYFFELLDWVDAFIQAALKMSIKWTKGCVGSSAGWWDGAQCSL